MERPSEVLPTPGGPMKQQDRPFLVLAQLANGHVLDDPLLDLLEPEVVFVEAAPDVGHLDVVGRRLGPREIGEPLQVRLGDVELRRLLLHRAEARELLLGNLLGFW